MRTPEAWPHLLLDLRAALLEVDPHLQSLPAATLSLATGGTGLLPPAGRLVPESWGAGVPAQTSVPSHSFRLGLRLLWAPSLDASPSLPPALTAPLLSRVWE